MKVVASRIVLLWNVGAGAFVLEGEGGNPKFSPFLSPHCLGRVSESASGLEKARFCLISELRFAL